MREQLLGLIQKHLIYYAYDESHHCCGCESAGRQSVIHLVEDLRKEYHFSVNEIFDTIDVSSMNKDVKSCLGETRRRMRRYEHYNNKKARKAKKKIIKAF